MGVYTMECVGYDEAFQRQVAEKWANWVPPLTKKRKAKNQPAPPNGKKRKISHDKKGKGKVEPHIEVDSEEELVVGESDGGEDSEVEDEDDSGDAGYSFYVPSGTRSRPRS
jgi:hypothetical protein